MDESSLINRILDGSSEAEARAALTSLGFVDWQSAAQRFRRIAGPAAGSRPYTDKPLAHLLQALSGSADPDQALINLERLLDGAESMAVSVGELTENPRALEMLVTIFSASQFLAEILVRDPRNLEVLIHRNRLARRKSADEYSEEARRAWAADRSEGMDTLRAYQRSELLRIGTCDLLDLYDLPAVTSQLSHLADGIVRASLEYASIRTGIQPDGFVVLAMGKLGGEELNYSSDIDLLFICSQGAADYLRLGQSLIQTLSGITSLGFLYRVDMRLRPWGREGALIVTADGYLDYLKRHARLWEKQALLKARPIAGDLNLGDDYLARANPLIFDSQPEEIRLSVYDIKQRTEQLLLNKGHEWGEVKLGEGSIRDIELVVQYLQLAFGRLHPEIHNRSTLQTLPHLTKAALLSIDEQRILTDGYIFLRTIEHYLQMMHYQQTHALPSNPESIQLLARRLGYQGLQAGERFVERYREHCQAIRAVFLRHVGNRSESALSSFHSPRVSEHLSRLDTSYSNAFTEEEIRAHADLIQQLDADTPVVVDTTRLNERTWRVTIVGYDFPGELSIICGLLFVHGFNILDGNVFTYEPASEEESGLLESRAPERFKPGRSRTRRPGRPSASQPRESVARQKIVDVFTVESVLFAPPGAKVWDDYEQQLIHLLGMMRQGNRREARGQLAKQVGTVFQALPGKPATLYPIDIEIDNDVSERYTVLRIAAPDTIGFLYEFTNALAFTRTNIARMIVRSVGNRARDTLYVTDAEGKKITAPQRQRELRAAAALIKHFTHLLPRSPNPEAALLHFREFIYQLFQRPNWPDEIASIERSEVLGALARLLGVSEFLWDDFLRLQYANLFPVVSNVDALATAKPRRQLEAELLEALDNNVIGETFYPGWRETLNAFKDRELFRIDMRHILSLTEEFWDFAAELTDLAEVVVTTAFSRCSAELRGRHGTPTLPGGEACEEAIFALGKCGGGELGFASDIELMFIYAGNGLTSGSEAIDNSDFYEKLVQDVIASIQARQEGIFHLDLQLRPYGKAGRLAVSLDAFRKYYAPGGAAWAYERQALVKMRQIAGSVDLGGRVSELRDSYVYLSGPFDVTAMRAMRERQIRHLVKGGSFNAKFSPGGLVDIEYLVQGLQINHGASNPALRATNLRQAMSALAEAGILSSLDHTRLRKAHTFVRWLIDSLRVVRGNSKEVTLPPHGSEEYGFLARRLLYGADIDRLRDDLARYARDVQEINQRLLPG